MGGRGEIAESTGVSTETAAETTHALVFQLLCADAEPGQWGRPMGKKPTHVRLSDGGESHGDPGPQGGWTGGRRAS